MSYSMEKKSKGKTIKIDKEHFVDQFKGSWWQEDFYSIIECAVFVKSALHL